MPASDTNITPDCDKAKAAPAWAPFCLVCSTMGRMTPIPGGWKCEGKGDHFGRAGCGNEIDHDLLPARSAIQRAEGGQ